MKSFLLISLMVGLMVGCTESGTSIDERDAADLVVYGKVYTSEEGRLHAEAFAVKDGKYIYVGNKEGASAYINKNKTKIVDYTDKGLVMPTSSLLTRMCSHASQRPFMKPSQLPHTSKARRRMAQTLKSKALAIGNR